MGSANVCLLDVQVDSCWRKETVRAISPGRLLVIMTMESGIETGVDENDGDNCQGSSWYRESVETPPTITDGGAQQGSVAQY